jgi:large subunit ribosomal protein L10
MKTTGFSRVSKDLIIAEVEKEVKSRSAFFVARHDTVSATGLNRLRAKLRTTGTRYLVVKKSLGKKAFEKANLKSISDVMDGACGIAFTNGDPVVSSKALMDFSKENEGFKVQTGYMNGQVMSLDQIKVLASLPSREVLIAKVVGTIQAPLSRFVGVLAGTLRKFVTVLDAVAKKKGEGK